MTTELVASKSELTTRTPTKSEQILIDTIRNEIELGKRATYWKVGRHIKRHLLRNKKRADYGKELYPLLSENLRIDMSTLYRSVKFYEEYPKNLAAQPELTWSHIKILLAITDIETRRTFEKQVIEQHLNEAELKELVRKRKSLPEKQDTSTVLSVSRDEPYVYLILKDEDDIELDLGFRVTFPPPSSDVTVGKVVRIEKDDTGYRVIPTVDSTTTHYVYKAKVKEVLDGDTIWVKIDLGFNVKIEQKLRFRGIDSEPIETPEGKTAKQYIEAKLSGCNFIAIKTHGRDKFDRYLTDIFYNKDETNFAKLVANGNFLNQELLDKGYAVEYEEGS